MNKLLRFKNIYLYFSGLVLLPGLVFILLGGLALSIDFTGGSVYQYQSSEDINTDQLADSLNTLNLGTFDVKKIDNKVTLQTSPLTNEQDQTVRNTISTQYPSLTLQTSENIGPVIGAETTKNAFRALSYALVGILIYISYSFRNIPKPYSSFRFGVSALLAMVHDVLFVLGLFAILGYFLNVQIDVLFITGLLTVVGFSVHDTIVVFDRIRENLTKMPAKTSFEDVANFSLHETLARSLATSFTVILTLGALFVLGGESIRYFVLLMLAGVISGTYSSIFTAVPILVLWEQYIARNAKKLS